jgi:hypothetical protein
MSRLLVVIAVFVYFYSVGSGQSIEHILGATTVLAHARYLISLI